MITGAVVQAASIMTDTPAAVEKAASLIREASAGGAQLIVFPEGFLGGYPKGHRFGASVGNRTDEGRQAFARYYAQAVTEDDPCLIPLAEACAETGTTVVMGVIERSGGTLYCATFTFDGQQGLVAKHRKIMPTGSERLIWGFGDGSTMEVSATQAGRVGSVICWENYMSSLRMHMYAQGIEFYCAPTADDGDGWVATMKHIALEGRCFVLSTCQFLTRGDVGPDPDNALGDDPDAVLLRGGAMIVDPLGKVLAGPHYDGETVLYADLDTSLIAQGKYQFDAVGHYARPDIFRLNVDTQPQAAVRLANTVPKKGKVN